MVSIVEKRIVDVLCRQDAEYKKLFQAMINFQRHHSVHNRTFLYLFAD